MRPGSSVECTLVTDARRKIASPHELVTIDALLSRHDLRERCEKVVVVTTRRAVVHDVRTRGHGMNGFDVERLLAIPAVAAAIRYERRVGRGAVGNAAAAVELACSRTAGHHEAWHRGSHLLERSASNASVIATVWPLPGNRAVARLIDLSVPRSCVRRVLPAHAHTEALRPGTTAGSVATCWP